MEYEPLTHAQRRMLHSRLLVRLFILLLVVAVVFLAGKPLLSLCMPFLMALILTALTEPILRFFHTRWKIPRGIVSLLLILLVVGGLGGILTAVVLRCWRELAELAGNWDSLWAAFQDVYLRLNQTFDQFLSHLPENVQEIIHDLSDRLLLWLNEMASRLVPRTTSAARSISSFVLGFLFFLMAWFFTASDYPGLRQAVSAHTPASIQDLWGKLCKAFSAAFGGYLKARLIISLGVVTILLTGFTVMGKSYSILLAILLGILDFIPIIGSGTVIVPWVLVDFILLNWREGCYLLIIWGIICVFRRVSEPKVVGDKTGLHPLLSVLAIYIGMRLGGILGMIVAPILVLMVRNLWQAGMFRATVRDLSLMLHDLHAILHTGQEKY